MVTIPTMNINVLTAQYDYVFPEFTVNTNTTNPVSCGNVTYILTPNTLPFATLTNQTKTLSVLTTDLAQVNTYNVSIVGTLDLY